MKEMEAIAHSKSIPLPTTESVESQQRFFEIERELFFKYRDPDEESSRPVRKRTTRPQERDWQTMVKRIRRFNRLHSD